MWAYTPSHIEPGGTETLHVQACLVTNYTINQIFALIQSAQVGIREVLELISLIAIRLTFILRTFVPSIDYA